VSQIARIADFITHGFNFRKHTGMGVLDIEKAYDTLWLAGLTLQINFTSLAGLSSFLP